MENQKLEFANALRGIAAISVVISHYLGVFWFARDAASGLANVPLPTEAVLPTPLLADWLSHLGFNWGPFGVALFFLISGFVIPFSLTRTTRLGFLAGRALRIYPLYMAGFTVTLASLWISGLISKQPFPYTLKNVLLHYIPGLRDLAWMPSIDGIIWTLEIELKFYIVCALAAPLLRKGRLATFAIPIALFVVVCSFHESAWGTLERTLAFNSEYMIFMFAGVAFNFYFRNCVTLPIFMALLTSLLIMVWAAMTLSGEPSITVISYGTAFVAFSGASLLAPWWPRIRLLSFFADISYPLYVTHGVMGYAILAHLVTRGISPTIAITITSMFAVLAAWVLHVAVETPTHRIGQLLTKRFALERADKEKKASLLAGV